VADSRKTLTVKLHFAENEYFSEKVLSLKVIYKPDSDDEVERLEGTNITWADESKDPTKKKIKKKQKHKKTNETRTIVKTVEAESIFNVFTSRVAPEEGMDEEEENELRDKIDMAMNFAEDIDDVLIPDALEYYLDLNDDMFDGEDMEDEDSDGDDDGSDDDGDKKSKKKADKKPDAGAAAGTE
jgi:nucleosome assembly protein 1-like 1